MKTGDFSSPEIDNIIDICIRKSQKSSLFEIPNFNDDKLKLVEELGGKLVKKTFIGKDFSQGHELFNGLISIDPSFVTKDIRSKLKIDRKLITINSLEQYKCISNDPSITIFPTENPQKFLVTFPNDKLQFLTEVVSNWEVYKKYKLVSEKSEPISMAKTGI